VRCEAQRLSQLAYTTSIFKTMCYCGLIQQPATRTSQPLAHHASFPCPAGWGEEMDKT